MLGSLPLTEIRNLGGGGEGDLESKPRNPYISIIITVIIICYFIAAGPYFSQDYVNTDKLATPNASSIVDVFNDMVPRFYRSIDLR